jgi:hypothetical protein
MVKFGTLSRLAYYGGHFQLGLWVFFLEMASLAISWYFGYLAIIDVNFKMWIPLLLFLFTIVGHVFASWFQTLTPLIGPFTGWGLMFKVIFMLIFVAGTEVAYEFLPWPYDVSCDFGWIVLTQILYVVMFMGNVVDSKKKPEDQGEKPIYTSLSMTESNPLNSEINKGQMEEKGNFVPFANISKLMGAAFWPGLSLFLANALKYTQHSGWFFWSGDKWPSYIQWGGLAVISLGEAGLIYYMTIKNKNKV